MKTFYFFLLVISILIGYIVIKDKDTKIFEFYVTKTNTTKSAVSMTPPKKVTIASLKDTIEETNDVDSDEENDENNEDIQTHKVTDCPEGYAYVNNKCQEVCHNCKLGTCEYGICY